MIYKGNHKLGDFFTSRRERGTPGLLMLSVTMNNGVVTRESLDRKMETNLSDEEHLLARKDDIVYNMMRMWQGASGLADRDGLLSPAYVVLAPKKGIDPLYASYLFKSSRFIYLFWAYSYGLTADRLRLYFNDFKRIPVNIPSLPEQRKIGKILSTWDKAIDITEKLIESSKAQKMALMQQLLTSKKRFPGFNEEWKTVRLGDVGQIASAGVDKNINQGEQKVRLLNFLDVYHLEFLFDKDLTQWVSAPSSKVISCNIKKGDIFFTPSSETRDELAVSSVAAEDMNGVVYSYHVVRFRLNEEWDFNFRAYIFQTDYFKHQTYRFGDGSGQRYVISQANFRKMMIKVPSVAEQKLIGEFLASVSKEIETLQQKLACLKQEKKALMQQLLTGKRRVKVDES